MSGNTVFVDGAMTTIPNSRTAAEVIMSESFAPGWPGSPGRWTSAAKSGVGTALGGSPIWFTLSHGILNEIYAPRIDEAATRDVGFLVAGPDGFVAEIKRHASHADALSAAGVPYYATRSECLQGRFRPADVRSSPMCSDRWCWCA